MKIKTHSGISKRMNVSGKGIIFRRKAAVHRKVLKKSSNMKSSLYRKMLLDKSLVNFVRKKLNLKVI